MARRHDLDPLRVHHMTQDDALEQTPDGEWIRAGAVDDWERLRRGLRIIETRLTTVEAVAQSMVNETEPESVEGRKAEIILEIVKRMLAELEEIAEEVVPPAAQK